jgi:hypothetical protein
VVKVAADGAEQNVLIWPVRKKNYNPVLKLFRHLRQACSDTGETQADQS